METYSTCKLKEDMKIIGTSFEIGELFTCKLKIVKSKKDCSTCELNENFSTMPFTKRESESLDDVFYEGHSKIEVDHANCINALNLESNIIGLNLPTVRSQIFKIELEDCSCGCGERYSKLPSNLVPFNLEKDINFPVYLSSSKSGALFKTGSVDCFQFTYLPQNQEHC